MERTFSRTREAFTLLELMLVIAVISILMSMLGAAAYSARQRAYTTTAAAEAQQIAAAFKSYYLAHHAWPGYWAGGKSYAALTQQNLDPLIGGKSGDGVVYLDISDFRFEDGVFVDPWGKPYEVGTDKIDVPVVSDVIEGAVSFPNHLRHYYEEGVYSSGTGAWDWDSYGN